MSQLQPLTQLSAGSQLLVGGDKFIVIDEQLAQTFRAGDSLSVVEATGEVLHIPARDRALAEQAVERAHQAFQAMGAVTEQQISEFYQNFASALANDKIWLQIRQVNKLDVADAKARGRSTTRLLADDALRANVIAGLKGWANATTKRGQVIETVVHEGWRADLVGAELGIVGFVFEGRPNVVADATGVLRGGNTVVFRIGRDALGTAKAMLSLALSPALREAGLPEGAVSIVDSASHAAGWALFSDQRLSLAVARGSGAAVDTLGNLAQRAGIPVSLHGTGGAWLAVSEAASPERLRQVVYDSLDRKVCNTLNTCCVPTAKADTLVPAVLEGLKQAGARRGQAYKLHVAQGSEGAIPQTLFETDVSVRRAQGDVREKQAEIVSAGSLGHEWEWEETPEITLKLVSSLDETVSLFNQQSPQFVACLLSPRREEHDWFYRHINAPFVGDGFTRWVDGQFALKRPELGLSNWQHGRLFGRPGILSGDSVYTVRTRVTSA